MACPFSEIDVGVAKVPNEVNFFVYTKGVQRRVSAYPLLERARNTKLTDDPIFEELTEDEPEADKGDCVPQQHLRRKSPVEETSIRRMP
jgi:hypothetical protein